MNPNNIQAQSIADDGTVAASASFSFLDSGWNLALWRPDAQDWRVLHRTITRAPVFISADASTAMADGPLNDATGKKNTLIWHEETGWKLLPNRNLKGSILYGVSQDFARIVGSGYHDLSGLRFPWIWDAENGQRKLPLTDEIRGGLPVAVSNDGEIVIGRTLRFPEGTQFPRQVGIIWENGGDPEVLRDDLGAELGIAFRCNHDCSLIFGSGQAEYDPNHPHAAEAWFLRQGQGVTYIGVPDDALGSASGVSAVSVDGSLAVGVYDQEEYERLGSFIWTQRTGMVSVDALIDKLGIGDHDWRTMQAVSVSSTGDKILMSGWFKTEDSQNRAVVLELKRKESLGKSN